MNNSMFDLTLDQSLKLNQYPHGTLPKKLQDEMYACLSFHQKLAHKKTKNLESGE